MSAAIYKDNMIFRIKSVANPDWSICTASIVLIQDISTLHQKQNDIIFSKL